MGPLAIKERLAAKGTGQREREQCPSRDKTDDSLYIEVMGEGLLWPFVYLDNMHEDFFC